MRAIKRLFLNIPAPQDVVNLAVLRTRSTGRIAALQTHRAPDADVPKLDRLDCIGVVIERGEIVDLSRFDARDDLTAQGPCIDRARIDAELALKQRRRQHPLLPSAQGGSGA